MTYGRLVSGQAVLGDLCRPADGKAPRASASSGAAEPETAKTDDSEADDGKKKGGFLSRLREKARND